MKSRTRNLAIIGALALVLVLCAARPARVSPEGKASEGEIARATAVVLERSQFSQRPLSALLSSQFLDRYLDALDGGHVLFLQSDLDEFAQFRPVLAQITVVKGDTMPAHVIYTRYLQRLAQEVHFATNFLHTAKFDFTGDDAWETDRREEPAPRDLAAAQALWREKVRAEYLLEELAGTPAGEIAPLLAGRYEHLLPTMRRLDTDEILEIYLGALAHVYDPHSDYFGREEAENFDIDMNLSLVGIGATLESRDGYCVITDLVPGGPAARSGLLKTGDRVVMVAQDRSKPVDVVDMPLPRLVELIRGRKGSTVSLTLIPAGTAGATRKTVSLVRDEIKLADQHAKAAIIDLPQTGGAPMRIGVIDLPSFYGSSDEKAGGAASDVARLIKKLQKEGARGLVLDLRRNGGGSLGEAIRLTGLFIPAGPVVQTRGPAGDVEVGLSPERKALYARPLVVLTSRASASASEIVAGALQDYGRALIVGDTSTFGKGTVQTVVPLEQLFHQRGLGAVKVTIRKFYRPSGASTQRKGVLPDIVLPSETDLRSISESKLPNALQWDILPPTSYTNFDLVQPVLEGLRAKSLARVDADPAFGLLREELEMADQREKARSLSLNESVRRGEMTRFMDVEAKLKKILHDDATRTPPRYDLTLATVDSAGLPPARPLPEAGAASSKPGENREEEDIDLRETENILADYIRALGARPSGEIVAGDSSESAASMK